MSGILGKNNVRVNFKKADSGNKEFAFMKAHELNNIEKLIKVKCDFCNGIGESDHAYLKGQSAIQDKYKCPRCKGYGHYFKKSVWRTGKNTMKQLIIETDNPDKENLSLIVNHINNLFGYKFNAIKTLHGFHIIGEKIYPTVHNFATKKEEPSDFWFFDNLKILRNDLEIGWQIQLYKILKIDEELRQYQDGGNYKDLFTTALRNSGLLNCVGDFDILYTVLSLKYGKSTLRISKKEENDKYEEVII